MQDGLRAYFSAYGDIDQCTIMRDPTGRSRGFAFLTFKDPQSVFRVLEKDHQLDGKMVSLTLMVLTYGCYRTVTVPSY